MNDVQDSTCPRCGAAFHCGVSDDSPCWCSQIRLSPQTLAELEKQYTRCLCGTCLRALAIESAAGEEAQRPHA